MQDLQLALVIAKWYESEFETTSTYKHIFQRRVLGHDTQAHQDPGGLPVEHGPLDPGGLQSGLGLSAGAAQSRSRHGYAAQSHYIT